MTAACSMFAREISDALGELPQPAIEAAGVGALPSVYAVTDLAAASIGSALAEVAAFAAEQLGREVSDGVHVDRRLASLWFHFTIQPDGWALPQVWDDLAGDYPGADGWIRLHTNAPHHRAAALRVLDCEATKAGVETAVKKLSVEQLEDDVVAEGGCAAAMRSEAAWLAHANGAAVAVEPLIDQAEVPGGEAVRVTPDPVRPLAGLRVLDLTRVLAGPVCTRFLAGWGADVLRLDPVDWQEGIVIPEVALGKRCARLDLKTSAGRAVLEQLLSKADLFVHGYRSDALSKLGIDADMRQQIRPGLIDVCLDAYGWRGPWRTRRGFDSLVQMSCGIADVGMKAAGSDVPRPLPVQALDRATGYLMAAAAVRGLRNRLRTGNGVRVRCSLARTARMLMTGLAGSLEDHLAEPGPEDWQASVEATSWGAARRLIPPGHAGALRMSWDIPAGELGRHQPAW